MRLSPLKVFYPLIPLVVPNARVRRAVSVRRSRPAGWDHCAGFRFALPDLRKSFESVTHGYKIPVFGQCSLVGSLLIPQWSCSKRAKFASRESLSSFKKLINLATALGCSTLGIMTECNDCDILMNTMNAHGWPLVSLQMRSSLSVIVPWRSSPDD